MKVEPMKIEGAFEISVEQHGDPRGVFLEWYRADALAAEIGHSLEVAQANISVSSQGVLRGFHFAQVPPGQAKYVTCIQGKVLDVILDVRIGSPTFGTWEKRQLDQNERTCLYLGEGLAHAFYTLSAEATLCYLCSQAYNPGREKTIHPLDPVIEFEWPGPSQLSERDANGPSLAQARELGILPDYTLCREYTRSLRTR